MIECSASDYVRMNVIVKLDRDNDSVIMIVMFFFPCCCMEAISFKEPQCDSILLAWDE